MRAGAVATSGRPPFPVRPAPRRPHRSTRTRRSRSAFGPRPAAVVASSSSVTAPKPCKWRDPASAEPCPTPDPRAVMTMVAPLHPKFGTSGRVNAVGVGPTRRVPGPDGLPPDQEVCRFAPSVGSEEGRSEAEDAPVRPHQPVAAGWGRRPCPAPDRSGPSRPWTPGIRHPRS